MTTGLKRIEIGGVILAGGQARRLGGLAKGRIEVERNVSIVEKLIDEFANAGINSVVIAANDSIPYLHFGVEVISDIRTGIGPIGGIETGLVHFAGLFDAAMFIPCDMPNITYREMTALKKAFIENKKPVVFAQTAGFFLHPLCAVVHIDLIDMVSSAIDSGQRKIRDLWQQLNAEAVQFSDNDAFVNINDFADMENWQKAMK